MQVLRLLQYRGSPFLCAYIIYLIYYNIIFYSIYTNNSSMNKIYLLSNYSCVDGDEKITNYAFTTKELAQAEMRRQIANVNLDDLELDYDTETAVSYVEHGHYEDWAIQELSVIGENIITHELCTSVYSR